MKSYLFYKSLNIYLGSYFSDLLIFTLFLIKLKVAKLFVILTILSARLAC